MIKEFTIVRLQTGEEAVIIDVLNNFAYIAEIAPNTNNERIEEITYSDIVSVFEEYAYPVSPKVA
jgi:hypothetical protein